MATPVDSANLINELYKLRREPEMREACSFMATFEPRSVSDYLAGLAGPNSSQIRMVLSYWEMAASFVVSGAIDAALFEASSDEHIVLFGKVDSILPELRETMGNPVLFRNLEQVCIQARKNAIRAEIEKMGL